VGGKRAQHFSARSNTQAATASADFFCSWILAQTRQRFLKLYFNLMLLKTLKNIVFDYILGNA
jgi:hypothetical protein